MAVELELEREPRARAVADRLDSAPTSRADRALCSAEGKASRRIVLGDLDGNRLLALAHPAHFRDPRPHSQRPLRIHVSAHEIPLPLAVTWEVVQIGKHLLWTPC